MFFFFLIADIIIYCEHIHCCFFFFVCCYLGFIFLALHLCPRATETQDIQHGKNNNRLTRHTTVLFFVLHYSLKYKLGLGQLVYMQCLLLSVTQKDSASNGNQCGSSRSNFSVLKYTFCLVKEMLSIFSAQYAF